ncbi:MAG: recombinase family protein [Pseudonocardiales bacterium]|nr:recombinase family protein [Pseudonocardiales bacterium]
MSTDHQSLDQQRDALDAAGCERVFSDQLSGVRDDRPRLVALLGLRWAGSAGC